MDALDRDIAAALAVDPSPEFVARVRSRVERTPAPSSWRVLPHLSVVAGAVAVVLLIAITSMPRGSQKSASLALATRVAAQVPTTAGRRAVPSAAVAGVALRRLQHRRRVPDVVIAASDIQGFREMAAFVRDGRVAISFADDMATAAVDAVSIRDIVIAPIEIAPVAVSKNSEGED